MVNTVLGVAAYIRYLLVSDALFCGLPPNSATDIVIFLELHTSHFPRMCYLGLSLVYIGL